MLGLCCVEVAPVLRRSRVSVVSVLCRCGVGALAVLCRCCVGVAFVRLCCVGVMSVSVVFALFVIGRTRHLKEGFTQPHLSQTLFYNIPRQSPHTNRNEKKQIQNTHTYTTARIVHSKECTEQTETCRSNTLVLRSLSSKCRRS